uniref:Bet v I/Major latex protein domain-containing protein n=1 Tax=Kalanchoe fedtschenkoi TaxID=63787 RepID=A0A7N0VGQ1_KALFE
MRGSVSSDYPVEAPADAVWASYRGLEVARLVNELLSQDLGTVEVLEGDGGVGTVLKATFVPGTPGPSYFIEKFTVMDDEARKKVTQTIEGGYLELGFKGYWLVFEVIEKDATSAIIRSSVEYELDDEDAEKASLVNTRLVDAIASAIGNYVAERYKASEFKGDDN